MTDNDSSNKKIKSSSQQQIKETNISLIFKLIDKYAPLSRAALAQMTKLSPTTISSLVDELIHNGFIVETGSGITSTSGRKPIMLEINPNGGFVASVKIDENGFSCFLYDLKCKRINGKFVKVNDFNLIGNDISDAAEELLKNSNIDINRLFSICIGIPGLIDYDNNRVISSTVVPMDIGNDFYDLINERYVDIPVIIGNESSFGAYAEKQIVYNGSVDNLVFIDIDTGIGAGVILEGNIYNGSYGMAGEFGHVSIDINGPKCKCGNKGCLEIMANIPAILQKVIFGIMSGRQTAVNEYIGNDISKLNIDIVNKALKKRDELVVEVVDDIAYKLAFGINNMINLLNPQIVVVGGEIRKLGDTFLDKVIQNVLSIALKPNTGKVKIQYTSLKDDATVLGGARYVLDKMFSSIGKLEVI